MAQRLISPLSYIGGKSRLAPKIIALLPADRHSYVEVFGGVGHVLTQKPIERNEIFNDVQGVIVNFFLVLKEHSDELVKRVERMPVSRQEHDRILEWWKAGRPGPITDIELAARWFYLLKTSFTSIVGHPYGYARSKTSQPTGSKFTNACARLEELALRWRQVNVELLDFADLIDRYDTTGTVFYCDPPYVGCEEYYAGSGFTREDHARLAAVLAGVKGRVIVSYYPDPHVDELYPADRWKRITHSAVKSSKITSRQQPGERPRATELLLLNYDPKTGRRLKPARRNARARKARSSTDAASGTDNPKAKRPRR